MHDRPSAPENQGVALPDLMTDEHGFIQGQRSTGHGTFLFLDTFKDGTSPGQFCEKRQGWLRAALDGADGPIRIFMHHPPCDIGVPYMDRIKLEEAEAFAEIVTQHEICHLFFGHVHRACFMTWRGIPCSALPGTNHQVPLVAGSTSSRYSVEPPMYGVIHVDRDQTIVHLDAYLDRQSADMP